MCELLALNFKLPSRATFSFHGFRHRGKITRTVGVSHTMIPIKSYDWSKNTGQKPMRASLRAV